MPVIHQKVIYAIRNCIRFVVPALAGSLDWPPKGGTTCLIQRLARKQLTKALPADYFLFTVPEPLRRLIRPDQKVCYTALFNAAGKEWKTADEKCYIHARPLSKLFRGIFMEALKKAKLNPPASV